MEGETLLVSLGFIRIYLEGIIHSKEDLASVQTWLDGYYKLANG